MLPTCLDGLGVRADALGAPRGVRETPRKAVAEAEGARGLPRRAPRKAAAEAKVRQGAAAGRLPASNDAVDMAQLCIAVLRTGALEPTGGGLLRTNRPSPDLSDELRLHARRRPPPLAGVIHPPAGGVGPPPLSDLRAADLPQYSG